LLQTCDIVLTGCGHFSSFVRGRSASKKKTRDRVEGVRTSFGVPNQQKVVPSATKPEGGELEGLVGGERLKKG